MNEEEKKVYKFGSKIIIDNSQIFYESKFVFAFVNLRPFLPGHCLVSPVRVEQKFSNLTETEAMELWISAKNIGENLKKYYQTSSIQYTIQDGEAAGQTVPHVHIHVIPIPVGYVSKGTDNPNITNRTKEDMAQEAENYRKKFVFP